jgi:hypothetical protein
MNSNQGGLIIYKAYFGEGVLRVRPCDNYLISLYSIGFNKILCKVRFPILDIMVVNEDYNRNI